MNRAFWRSVEIIDDIDDREEVAPRDARYYRPSEKAFAVRPIDCKHERAKVECPDCGIDFLGGIRTAPRDVPIWICSVCGGWNHVQDKFCTHTHAVKSAENGKASHE